MTACTFHGSEKANSLPARSTYQSSKSPLKKIRVDACTADRAAAIEQALAVTLEIFGSADFQAVLKREHLHRGPADKRDASGQEVVTFLTTGLPESVTFLERRQGFWGFWGLGSTTATTDESTTPDLVSIAPFRVSEWTEGRSGKLVNTVAHELTHLHKNYVDGERTYCLEATLVSYRVGDLAQCFYETRGEVAEFEQCAAVMTNGVPDRARRLEECGESAE